MARAGNCLSRRPRFRGGLRDGDTVVSKPPEGAWFFIDRNRYRTRGAEVRHNGKDGWFAVVGRRIRGPLNSLDAAMAAADRMLAESAKASLPASAPA